MNENNNQNDKPLDGAKSSDETQVELREITKDELKQILEDHKKWLESDGKEGERADFSRANLSETPFYDTNLSQAYFDKANLYNAGFSGVNLQKAIFSEAKLQKAKFYQSDLQKAAFDNCDLRGAKLHLLNLQKTNFSSADLSNASLVDSELNGANLCRAKMQNTTLVNIKSFADSELHYANLEGATGLLGNEFAQADLTGTKLPTNIEEFKSLETVKETSQNARKIFFAMLLGCVYSWLTIATTTDVRLLTNTASSPLPIIGTEIPIAWFYIAAPLILICLYLYFHLYLDNLWGALASLPAIFPDGKRLDERAYPWLLNTLVRRHFKRLKNRPLIARMKEWITIFLAWFVVPLTMIAFWLRYIPRHDWIGTRLHIGLITVSVAFAIIFYRLCASTLQGKKKVSFGLKNFWKDGRFYFGVSIVLVGIFFSLLSYGAIDGVKDWYWPIEKNEKNEKTIYTIKDIVPLFFERFGYSVFASFKEKKVSEIPPNYWELLKEDRFEAVEEANLKDANLNNADMYKAFMVKADLRGAFINNADLYKVNLQQADLSGVEMQKSHLKESNLQKAKLENANLMEAIFVDANLYKAIIKDSNLQEANLLWSNFEQADLMRTNLNKAYILGTNLQEAILTYANFLNAKVHEADLHKADFQDANLELADFSNSNLTGAKNLTIDQLSKVKTLYEAKLDPELLEQVKQCCPHLLEKPKEETDENN